MKNLKKVTSVFICTLILAVSCFCFSAYATVQDGITYTVINGSSLSITSVQSTVSGVVKIPAQVDGMDVVKIAGNAFKDKTSIISVEIPETVTSVGANAFGNCSGIQIVRFDSSASAVTIGAGAFRNCSALEKAVLPENISAIPSDCFAGCSSLAGISIPDTVTSIGSEAFLGCSSLTVVCIPASVSSVGAKAFANCLGAETFSVADGNKNYKVYDGVLYTSDASELIQYPLAKSGSSYTVKSGVKTIDEYAFANSSLASVTLPSGLVTIGGYAFSDCKKLTSVTVPGSVQSFSNAFEGSGLVSAVVESGIKTIPEYSFSYCSSLESVTLPAGLETIELCAFYKDSSLQSVIIPTGTVTVDSAAFSECTSLKKVHMPESLTDIASNAFSGSSNVVICSYSDSFYSKTYASANGISFTTCTGDETPSTQIAIKNNNGSRTINYGYTLNLTVDPATVPAGCSVEWEVSGSGYSASHSGNTCSVKCTGSGTANVTAKLMCSGSVISATTESVVCNSNFFLKIIAFFKGLFGSNMIINQ